MTPMSAGMVNGRAVKALRKTASAARRVRQLLTHNMRDLVWLGYVLAIAPWAHRAAGPLHYLRRWQAHRRRARDIDDRMRLLRARVSGQFAAHGGYRVALAELSPELDDICRPLRRCNDDIPLAAIDQDGLLCPQLKRLWPAPCINASAFLPRRRFELMVVDHGGWVGVRKRFRGDKAAFLNELEATLDLTAAGCRVAPIFGIDFERLSITFAYLDGVVVREALAEAGAPLRDRDVPPNLRRLDYRRFERERCEVARRLVDSVLDTETIEGFGRALLAIHRAGYVLEDVKYGNMIIETTTRMPYFVDCERALPLREHSRPTATYLRDRDADKLNRLIGTNLITARRLRRLSFTSATTYSPFYAGTGIRWGPIWNPDLGMLRWRHMLSEYVPVPHGGRVLDLGANNGFNALQMLRAGAREVIGVEIDPAAIQQGLFVKKLFEWADNIEYRFSYVQGSHGEAGSMNLGKFDLVTAFCTLYYLSADAMARTVSDLSAVADTLVLQCNNERSIERRDPETFTRASLPFNVELVRNNGFPNVAVIERTGSDRPLVIARTR